MAEPTFMTAEEIAELCRVTVKTVKNTWAYRDDFPSSFRMGKARVWKRADVMAWIASKEKK